MAGELGTLSATLGVDTSQLGKARRAMGQFASGADTQFGRAQGAAGGFTNGLKALGVVMTATLAIKKMVDFGNASVTAFGNMQASLIKTSTLFGNTEVNMKNLTRQTVGLSSATGIAAQEIGEAMYQALSAGIAVTEDMGVALKFMKSSATLARAGFTTLSSAVDATTKTLNAYGLAATEADRIQRILINTQNRGITTVDELSGYLSMVTPTAAAMGVAFEQVGAALGVITSLGTRTSVSVTQLNALIAELGKQGTKASKGLTSAAISAGLSITNFKDMMAAGMDLGEVLDIMNDYAEQSGLGMLDLFSSIEAGKAGLQLSGNNLKTFNRNMKDMATVADVVGAAAGKVMTALQVQTGLLGNDIVNLKSTVGEVLAPAIIDITLRTRAWVNHNRELIEQKMEVWADNLAKATGFVLDNLDKIAFIVKGLVAMKMYDWFIIAATGAGTFAGALGVATFAAKMLGRALLFGFIVEGINLILKAYNDLDAVIKASPVTWGEYAILSADAFANGIFNGFQAIGQSVIDMTRLILDPVVAMFQATFSMQSFKDMVSGNTAAVFKRVGDASTDALAKAWERIPENFSNIMKNRNFKLATDDMIKRYNESFKEPVKFAPLNLGPNFWQTTQAPPVPPKPDPTAQSTTSTDFDSYYTQLTGKYQDLQDQMTLSNLDGWAKRTKTIEIWASNLKQEMTNKGVYTDEMATALGRVTTAEYAMIDAERLMESNDAFASVTAQLQSMVNTVKAIDAGPKAFAMFEDLQKDNAQLAIFIANLKKVKGNTPEGIEEQIALYKKWLGLLDESKAKVDKWKEWENTISSSLTGAFSKFSDYMVSSLLKGEASWKSFGQMAMGVLENITNELIKQAIIKPIVSGLTDGIMGMFSPTPSAKGNVFGSTGIHAFAKGGVVSQPTIFPFAHGTGLMGEKGSEAIMPLTRIGGDLGVKAVGMGGGGSSVIVNIMNNGQPVEVESQSQSTNGDGQTIIDLTVRQAISRLDGSGQLDNVFNRHGAKRVGGR